jgi:uncharacterized membrane protein YjjP (DUF1212 family)
MITTASPSDSSAHSRPATTLILRLARALHNYGTPAHRLEEVVNRCALELGLQAQAFSLPTSIFISFGPMDDQQTFCLRVEPGEVHLEKLSLLDRVWNDVIAQTLSPADGVREIEAIENQPMRYGPLMSLASFALISGSAARFFGGGWREMLASLGIGLVIGAIGQVALHRRDTRRLFEFVAGCIAALGAILATTWLGPLATLMVMLGSLIVLLPGLTLTVAINELATRNLMSGTARLVGAMMVFSSIGVGVALGRTIGLYCIESPEIEHLQPLAPWTLYASLLMATPCLGVLFHAAPRDIPLVAVAGTIAFLSGRAGAFVLGPELGVTLAAMMVGVLSNAYARWSDRPAAIPMMPGIIMLVPGGIGFMSLNALLFKDVVAGIDAAFSMFLIAAGLVAGLLLANVAVPPRKAL